MRVPAVLVKPLVGRARLPLAAAAAAVAAVAAVAVASPAAAAALPTAPVVTPSTTATVTVGTPMTMTVQPGSDSGAVYGYAWTWQRSAGAPTYTSLPSCRDDDATGGVHFVCGSSVTLRVSPEDTPFASFRVWAFDAAGDRSPVTAVQVSTLAPTESLYPVAHQWTTDQFGMLPPPSTCDAGGAELTCVADTAGVDDTHPAGAFPVPVPAGVTWDDSGSWAGVVGVLNFGADSATPMHSAPGVVDTAKSFTVGAWVTPTEAAGSAPETAISGLGLAGTGFELRLNTAQQWEFSVHGPGTRGTVVAPATYLPGNPVYVAGEWDAVNQELRLSYNGSTAAVSGYRPLPVPGSRTTVTIGSRLAQGTAVDRFTGQIGNPVVVQAPLTPFQLSMLQFGAFFPGSDADLG